MAQSFLDELYNGLNALAESSFPKECRTCGKIFQDIEEFVRETEQVGVSSGLKSSQDDDESQIVELFRNCTCGSTLMDVCGDRRDTSEAGLKRRQAFSKILKILEKKGVEPGLGRLEILKVIGGQESVLIQKLKKNKKI